MATAMTRLYSDLAGCDFTNDSAKVSLTRSPNCVNMYRDYSSTDGNCVQTRPGLKALYEKSDDDKKNIINTSYSVSVNGIFMFKLNYSKKLFIHVDNILYMCDYPSVELTEENQLYTAMNNARSSFVIFNDKLYINDGLNYLVYDGEELKNVSDDAFVPTTTISRAPIGGGELYQDVNVLTARRKNSFCADGESTEYYLDTTELDDTDVTVYINDVEIDSSLYSVNTTLGIITFTTAPEAPDTEGEDNVIIEFNKAGTDYADRIPNCTKSLAFDNRIFFTGNSQFKNAVFHCELNNPAYVSDLNYYEDGTSDSAIKDFTIGNNLLWVFKESSQQNDTIFYHTPSIDSDYGKIYPSKQGNISTGCVSECRNFNDDIVFLSSLGLEGITGDIDTEQLISHRSSLIDAKLINENNYTSAMMEEWNGYLLILVDGKIYLADSRQVYQGNRGAYEYEWYYWEFCEQFETYFGNVCLIKNIEDNLIIATSKGFVYMFDSSSIVDEEELACKQVILGTHTYDPNDLLSDGVWDPDSSIEEEADGYELTTKIITTEDIATGTSTSTTYYVKTYYKYESIGNSPIYSCWQMPNDIFEDTNNLKTTNKRGGVAKIKTIPNGKVTVSVKTNRKDEKVIKTYSATGFDFANIEFDNFAFTTKDMSYIVYKIKMKKFIELTLKFYSEDRPFGLYDATIEVYQGSYIKRT